VTDTLFIKADEVAVELGVSKPYAYKLVRKLNQELAQKGFIVISGRVSREYYREKIYAGTGPEKGVLHGSV
jgi:hypothetical protein